MLSYSQSAKSRNATATGRQSPSVQPTIHQQQPMDFFGNVTVSCSCDFVAQQHCVPGTSQQENTQARSSYCVLLEFSFKSVGY